MLRTPGALGAVTIVAIACGGGSGQPDGTVAYFDLDGNVDTGATFYDHPFPSDLRLTEDGRPDLTGYPNPRDLPVLNQLMTVAVDRYAFPVMPVAYFRFTAPLAPRSAGDVIAADPGSPVLLIDVDPDSPDRGALYPTVAPTMIIDDYVPGHVLAVAPRPGFVLHGDRTYAVVVMRSLGDAEGAELDTPRALQELAAGETPDGAWGAAAAATFAPLWDTLGELGLDPAEVAVATVFTTADVVAELHELSEGVVDAYDIEILDLAIEPAGGADHTRFCELVGRVVYPQFQRGTPPFDSEGLFEIGDDGLPIQQGTEEAPIAITLPLGEMPADGYPIMVYFHGSGGTHDQAVNRGKTMAAGGSPTPGEGPAYVVAEHGIASAASALPVNPERLPGAAATEYLNFNNLAALRDLFRQGVLEQRLFVEALVELEISPAVVSACSGLSLPAGATGYRFDPAGFVASGQSMGGMYTNMVGAVEPMFGAAVPTGAGGFWHYFILHTNLIEGVRDLMAVLIGTPEPDLTFMHPGMQLIHLGWEAADPVVYMPRLGLRPLPGHPARPVYEPAGRNDGYFPTLIYDAAALAYGNEQAGEEVWPEMQEALVLDGRGTLVDYAVTDNLTSENGDPYTGVVVQYAEDEILGDGHYVFAQLDEVKYQYACFFATYLARGAATVPAPAALGTPCP